MPKMTAAERYAARQVRKAQTLRLQTLRSADIGARHARLRAHHGPDWQQIISQLTSDRLTLWDQIAERNPNWDGWYSPLAPRRPRNPYARPTDPEFGRHEWRPR